LGLGPTPTPTPIGNENSIELFEKTIILLNQNNYIYNKVIKF